MPYYRCVFLDARGRMNKRTLFADSVEEIRKNEGDEKLISAKRDWLSKSTGGDFLGGKISAKEFLQFNQKLVVLLRAGVSVINALGVIISNMKKGAFHDILSDVQKDIRNGVLLSQAFNNPRIPFNKIYVASLVAGEKSGALENVIERFNSYLTKITSLRRKLFSSLAYPVVLLMTMVAMVVVVMIYVIPKFEEFFTNLDSELPATTRFLISFSSWMEANAGIIVLLLVGVYFAVKFIEKRFPKITVFDYLKLKLPFVGSVILENSMLVFSKTLSILISGGIPVPESVGIAVQTISNKYIYSKVVHMQSDIQEGRLFSEVLEEIDVVPGIMVEVIKVGESSGNIVDVLDRNSDFLEESIDARVSTMISLIEPIMLVVLGLAVAFMLASIYIPIFSTVNLVR